MGNGTRALTLVALTASLGYAALRAQTPAPPVKPGLWQVKMSQLDASGKEVPPPEMAGFARMSPAARAQMEERMRGRGVQLPDENGFVKTCVTRESLDSGDWQQVAAEAGCTTKYSTRTASVWKWHTSCTANHSESDGEMTFTGSEAYRTTVTSTIVMNGATRTVTRVMQGKWLAAACGDVRPLGAPPTGRGR